jgi:Fur family ferric uptake transcriptional regulator
MKNSADKLLTSVSLRRTRPRLAILEALLTANHPLSQEQIAENIGLDAPNKTTIYRTLTNLVETGLVHEAFLEHRVQYYELAHNCGQKCCHPHFTCSRCLQTLCMTHVAAPMVQLPEDFQVQRQQIHIEGICPKCLDKTHH